MLVFLFLVALAVVGFSAGRMRRAPAFLDGAAQDVKRLNRGRLGRGGNGGMLNR